MPIYGTPGNDTLQGTSGADEMYGGAGDDTYWYWGADLIVELAGEGTDTVLTYQVGRFYLPPNVENARIGTRMSADFVGNELDNQLSGGHPTSSNRLEGGAGNDTLTGSGAYNYLDGGPGADYIYGADGPDDIVYDPDDAVVLAGNGQYFTDTLLVLSGDMPIGYDLAAHEFERAERRFVDGPSGAWWDTISDFYSVSWLKTESTFLADDGRWIRTTYDVSPGGSGVNWQYITDYQQSRTGPQTHQDGLFDDGSTFAKSYDYAAGTATDGVADWLREYTYFFRNVADQQTGLARNVEGFADDGRKFTQTNDIDADQPWQFQTNWYKIDGTTLDFQETRWDDGTTTIVPY
jgi:Ca2+-binding RTX toxin-like protein